MHEDSEWDEGSRVIYQSAGHETTQEGEQCLYGWFGKVVQGLDAPVNGNGVQVCIKTILDQEGADWHGINENPFMSEVCIFLQGGRLDVVELVFKIVLVGYLDGGLVEDFPWEEHILWRVSR